MICIGLYSCKKDDTSSTVKIDGQLNINQVKAPLDSVTAVLDTSVNFVNGYTERRLIIYLFSGNNKLRLIANNWSYQNPPKNGITNKSYMTCTDDSSCNWCIGNIPDRICDGGVVDWFTLPYAYTSIGTKIGYVDIVSNDTINLTVNCLFSSILLNINGQPDSILVDGEINKLKYLIKG